MRVLFPLLAALVAVATARDDLATASTTSTTKTRRTTKDTKRSLRRKAQDENNANRELFALDKKGFLSIPQDDPNPVGRARRLSYRAPFWEFTSYDSYNPELVNLTMAAPGGILGQAALGEQSATIAGQLDVSVATSLGVLVPPLQAACLTISETGECLEHLDSYLHLYSALAPEYQPAAFQFYDSDYAFARERITSSPAFITRVNRVGDIPFTQANVTGYNAITGGVPLADLVAQGRVFIVDFYPFYQDGVLEAAPHSVLEAPTAVFFLDGPPKKGSSIDNLSKFAATTRLMPLAIKYNVQHSYVVSPKDPHADWFLAKAVFNCLDSDVNSILHFALHSAIANVAIAAQKNLASEHPLFRPIELAAAENFGIIFAGLELLVSPGGSFDTDLSLSGSSVKNSLFPYFMQRFDWRVAANLSGDLAARGVTDIPGFLYRDDAAAIYNALYAYSEIYLAAFYKKPDSVMKDAELQGFLAALTNTSDSIAFLKGFPTTADVTNIKEVSALLTQILWVTGVKHHALNSYRSFNFDSVFPSHPRKILAPLPPRKGTLSDDEVQQDYISGAGFTAAEATSQDRYTPDLTTLEIANPLALFLSTQILAFVFYPLLQKPSRLTNIYLSDTEGLLMAVAAVALRQELRAISARIVKREAANIDSPRYLLLDPATLPLNLYV